eukprot:jgi/Mesen1/5720/ME000289S04824
MELRGLFQYLNDQLKRGEGTELILLQELVQQMASVEHVENLTEDQLDAMAGGEVLRQLAATFVQVRNNKVSAMPWACKEEEGARKRERESELRLRRKCREL